MSDKTTAPELPARIWAFEDYPGQGAVPRGGMWCDEQSETPEGSPCYIRRDLCASGQARARMVELADVLDQHITDNDLSPHRLLLGGAVYTGPAVDWAHCVLSELRDLLRKYAALTPAPQPEGDHRSFPEAADGRPMPPMGDDLMIAGLNGEDARFVALQLAQNGLMLVPAPQPAGHPDDIAVNRFAYAMKTKLSRKRAAGRGGWNDKDACSAAFLSQLLREHVAKGDPVDVGNFAMMLHQRGERIVPTPSPATPTAQEAVPVAWQVRYHSKWITAPSCWTDEDRANWPGEHRPLYAYSPQPSETAEGADSWCDLKVAFDILDSDAVWAASADTWPKGWELNETDGAGARMVAVFRVDHLPTADETRGVAAALRALKGEA